MAIKPVTYQGVTNFKANLYALEVKSRFIDQSSANGYYKGYGDELAATVSSNTITIGSGAFLIQGRLNEIETGGESVEVEIQNGYVGFVCARIETYRPDDTENCTLVVKTGANAESISFTQEDTYAKTAETENKVYEYPLYAFSMANGRINIVAKTISPVEENTETRNIATNAKSTADTAKTTATNAKSTADTASANASAAVSTANTAKSTADTASANASAAVLTANTAKSTADTAKTTATNAKSTADTASANASAAVSTANEAKQKIDQIADDILNITYPIGSIYMSTSATSPASIFGGTWQRWGNGRVPVGVCENSDDASLRIAFGINPDKTGGSLYHIHQTGYGYVGASYAYAALGDAYNGSTGFSTDKSDKRYVIYGGAADLNFAESLLTSGSSGDGSAYNSLQPFITCYMWKRTA